jgi:RimJ/RimL family protein N-acetyltransferase
MQMDSGISKMIPGDPSAFFQLWLKFNWLNGECNMMNIETDRLMLREMTEADFEALYAVLADADTMKHYPHPFNEDSVRECVTAGI